jgi:hypothetical protein
MEGTRTFRFSTEEDVCGRPSSLVANGSKESGKGEGDSEPDGRRECNTTFLLVSLLVVRLWEEECRES